MKIKVLIVDDSAVTRSILSEIINATQDMHVVAAVGNEAQARQAMSEKRPDVMTLDVEMAAFNGLHFLAEIMRNRPLPVLVVSHANTRGSKSALRALELGAVDFAIKPETVLRHGTSVLADELRERIRATRKARVLPEQRHAAPAPSDSPSRSSALSSATLTDKVIVIGASTGGTEAIREVLTPLPAEMPPILIVQHMPELFTASFAKRLNNLSRVTVKEAEQGELIRPGTAYLAPGHSHLSLKRIGGALACELSDAPPVNRHRPSVDVLFFSAAKMLGPRALGVLLTGMGKDGAQGMLAMRDAGAWTVAQDEDSCIVWGMPREAILIGGAKEVASLQHIPELVLQHLRSGERRAA